MAIIKLIEERPGITRLEIAKKIGIHEVNVCKHLKAIERGNGIMMHNGGDYLYIEQYKLIKQKEHINKSSPYHYSILK